MRLMKSLLCGFSALAFAIGAAFAETSEPQLLSDENFGSGESRSEMSSTMELESADRYGGSIDQEQSAMPEGEVIYIYPVEVTEYYLIIPQSQDLG